MLFIYLRSFVGTSAACSVQLRSRPQAVWGPEAAASYKCRDTSETGRYASWPGLHVSLTKLTSGPLYSGWFSLLHQTTSSKNDSNFRYITLSSLIEVFWCFGGRNCLHLQGRE
jgi:hypothetical protein